MAVAAISLSEAEERELRRRAAQYTRPHREVIRAKVVLLAAVGYHDSEIARRLDCTDKTAGKWRRRFASEGLAGLDERPRPGRPRSFPPAEIAEVKALACELPAQTGRPLSRWSAAELAREAVARGIVCQVSGTTVWRWLAEDAIRPWAWRSWVFPRDPEFREKAGVVLDLYERRWQGRRLHPGDYVISVDEKTQLQALLRRHPLVAPGPRRPGLVEHEYRRRGTLAYLAAMDVHDPARGMFGSCGPTISNDAFDALVEQVMTTEPYASAQCVYWVVDNGTVHRGQKAIDRLQGAWANLVLVHLPKHASWLNQIEIYFSILARKALTPCHFDSLDDLADRVLGFQAEFAKTATPFNWTFTRRDLHALLDRLDQRGRLKPAA